jgi:hypothetical protein
MSVRLYRERDVHFLDLCNICLLSGLLIEKKIAWSTLGIVLLKIH